MIGRPRSTVDGVDLSEQINCLSRQSQVVLDYIRSYPCRSWDVQVAGVPTRHQTIVMLECNKLFYCFIFYC